MENKYYKILYKLAYKAYKQNEIPVSALIVKDNKIIAKAYNKKNIGNSCLKHAEIMCIQKAYRKLKRWNLNDCILYVSLEPCNMCKNIIGESRIDQVFYILKQGKINNTYSKTRYEQTFDFVRADFQSLMNKMFEKIRK